MWNPLGSNPEHIKAHGVRPASQECDALRRVDLQWSLMETGIQLLWNLWFGASAKAGQKYFGWRMLLCEDQSITQGQFGFNQRLMKNGQVFKVIAGSVSLSAQHLCCLPSWGGESSELLTNSLIFCGTSDELPGRWLQLLAVVQLSWCASVALGFWLSGLQLLSSRLPISTAVSRAARCRTARASVLNWPFADSAKILSFHPNQN